MHLAGGIQSTSQLLFILAPFRKKTSTWWSTVAGCLSVGSPMYFRSGAQEFGEPGWWKLVHNKPPTMKPEGEKLSASTLKVKGAGGWGAARVQPGPAGEAALTVHTLLGHSCQTDTSVCLPASPHVPCREYCHSQPPDCCGLFALVSGSFSVSSPDFVFKLFIMDILAHRVLSGKVSFPLAVHSHTLLLAVLQYFALAFHQSHTLITKKQIPGTIFK